MLLGAGIEIRSYHKTGHFWLGPWPKSQKAGSRRWQVGQRTSSYGAKKNYMKPKTRASHLLKVHSELPAYIIN